MKKKNPNKPAKIMFSFYVESKVKQAASDRAIRDDRSLSQVMRKLMSDWATLSPCNTEAAVKMNLG